MSNLHFEYPYLLLIFPISLICIKYCLQKEDAILFSNIRFLKKSSKKSFLIEFFKIFTLLFLTLSLSSPYSIKRYERVEKDSISLSLLVDISLSMQENFKKVKSSLKKFIEKRDGDYISLIYFADSVAIASPFTKDIKFLKKSLDSIKVGDLGEIDTHLYDAIVLANSLKKENNTSIKIVFTDGVDKGSQISLTELINLLSTSNSSVYSVGFGDEYDKDILKTISTKSGGKFFKTKVDNLSKVLDEVDRLYPKHRYKNSYILKEPLYQIPLFFAFLSLLFYTYLLNKRAVI